MAVAQESLAVSATPLHSNRICCMMLTLCSSAPCPAAFETESASRSSARATDGQQNSNRVQQAMTILLLLSASLCARVDCRCQTQQLSLSRKQTILIRLYRTSVQQVQSIRTGWMLTNPADNTTSLRCLCLADAQTLRAREESGEEIEICIGKLTEAHQQRPHSKLRRRELSCSLFLAVPLCA